MGDKLTSSSDEFIPHSTLKKMHAQCSENKRKTPRRTSVEDDKVVCYTPCAGSDEKESMMDTIASSECVLFHNTSFLS